MTLQRRANAPVRLSSDVEGDAFVVTHLVSGSRFDISLSFWILLFSPPVNKQKITTINKFVPIIMYNRKYCLTAIFVYGRLIVLIVSEAPRQQIWIQFIVLRYGEKRFVNGPLVEGKVFKGYACGQEGE